MPRHRKYRGGSDPGDLYLSPYELWTFGAGKGYASPDIRQVQ